jgi:hypothetical protein
LRRKVANFPDGGVLIWAENGLFLARDVNGTVTVTPAGKMDVEGILELRDFPAIGVLIGTRQGLFLAREANGIVTVAPASDRDIGYVYGLANFPGGGVLIWAEKGLFLAREANGMVTVTPTGDVSTGLVYRVSNFPGGRALIGAEGGLFVTVAIPLSDAVVTVKTKKNLDIGPIDRDVTLEFVMQHRCAAVGNHLGLKVRVTAPGVKPKDSDRQFITLTPDPMIAEVTLPNLRIDRGDQWSFQLIATSNGNVRLVGSPQTLTFVSGPWWERWWKVFAAALAVILALTNVVLFVLARRSAWAWRVATDDGWGTWVLRVATLILSYFPQAQLWIIDLYYQRIRARVQAQAARPFLPLPLSTRGGSSRVSTDVLAPSWSGRRLWVQGGSGMGKTALFRNITENHFREHDTAYTAHAKWRCVLVAFAARDFAGSGEDKDDPAWVIDAVRATLSSEGLTFANSTLLWRFLQNGTLGVAIDGLNEVDRTRAVAAFTRAFNDAPMLVTSQQPGNDRFTTWRLPPDIREFTSDLMRLYLSEDKAQAVMSRIAACGLKDAIRSGYDVRLVIDLVKPIHSTRSFRPIGWDCMRRY